MGVSGEESCLGDGGVEKSGREVKGGGVAGGWSGGWGAREVWACAERDWEGVEEN